VSNRLADPFDLLPWAAQALIHPADAPPCPRPDADAVKAFLDHHGAGPCIHWQLSSHGRGAGLPAGAFDRSAAVAEDMARDHEFGRVMRTCFERMERPPIVFKGQALAHCLYPHSWLRPRGDVDVLVPGDDDAALAPLLEAAGYRRGVAIDGGLVMTQAVYRRTATGIEHSWDVHWRISNRPALADAMGYAQMAHGADTLRAADVSFPAAGTTDALLAACIHLAGHYLDDIKLIWLYDIHLLAGSLSDAERGRFLRHAASGPALHAACSAGLALAHDHLPSTSLAGLKNALGDDGAGYARRAYAGHLLQDIRALRGADRWRLLRQHLFPSARYMRERFGVRRRAALPWWYAVRLARAIPGLFRRR